MKKILLVLGACLVTLFLLFLSSSTGQNTLTVDAQTPPPTSDWFTLGANYKRTSWVSEEVSGSLNVEWYRPIEAYIGQSTQLVTVNDIVYVSTAKGLYAIRTTDGSTAWKFKTELPMGNSPTVINGVVYVGNLDGKIYALNASTGAKVWESAGAKAGFSSNPIVVNNKVYAGSRDGYFYAFNLSNGTLAWQYPQAGQPPLGPLILSAAYDSGVFYFVDNTNIAYALNENGTLVWKTDNKRLPGDRYTVGWPVIYNNDVVFSPATSYVTAGFRYVNGAPNNGDVNVFDKDMLELDTDALKMSQYSYGRQGAASTFTGVTFPWSSTTTTIDASGPLQYLTDMPWRRSSVFLAKSTGLESVIAPIVFTGTENGNRYPPIVLGTNNVIYWDAKLQPISSPYPAATLGWKYGSQYLSINGGNHAHDEPVAISGGGNVIYFNLCCARSASFTNVNGGGGGLWDYDLANKAPGYDVMWGGPVTSTYPPGWEGSYTDVPNSNGTSFADANGIYSHHGFQNPIIPYKGKVFTHRKNAIIVFGKGSSQGKKPVLRINESGDSAVEAATSSLTVSDASQALAREVQKVMDAGPYLRIPYSYEGMITLRMPGLSRYFENPADTLYALSLAYPYLPASQQTQLKAYLRNYFSLFFYPTKYYSLGYSQGAASESMPIPPEVTTLWQEKDSSGNYYRGKLTGASSTSWQWSWWPNSHLALYTYAKNVAPEDTQNAYTVAKGILSSPGNGSYCVFAHFAETIRQPFCDNAYATGYDGFLKLQQLAGKDTTDTSQKSTAQNGLNTVLTRRRDEFNNGSTIDSPYDSTINYETVQMRAINVSRNFMFLSPSLGDYLNTNARSAVDQAMAKYTADAPYWMQVAFGADIIEGGVGFIQNHQSLFNVHAYIYKDNFQELAKYLDVPNYERGDMYYIQNLTSLLAVAGQVPTVTVPSPTNTVVPPSATPTPMAPGDVNGDGNINLVDLATLLGNFAKPGNRSQGDLDGNGSINLSDLSQLLANFGKGLSQPTPTNVIATPTTVVATPTLPAPTPTSTSNLVVALNAGGSAFTSATGIAYGADQYFTGGGTYSTNNAIANTTDDPIYQSERWGNFTYHIPVSTNGTYQITLQFAETFFTQAGRRVFSMSVEGNPAVTNLDIFTQAGGANTAYDVTVPVTVSDGFVDISVTVGVDNPKLSGIIVKK